MNKILNMVTSTIDRRKKWTMDDYQQTDEDVKCEIINSELVMIPASNIKHKKVSMA